MRYKNKVFCDCCGKFISKLNKKKMDFINQEWSNGTRVTCSYVCDVCSIKNEREIKKNKGVRK